MKGVSSMSGVGAIGRGARTGTKSEVQGSYAYQPWRFFALVALFSWAPWGIAAYTRVDVSQSTLVGILCLLGLLGPCLAAGAMLWCAAYKGQRHIAHDFKHRLKDVPGVLGKGALRLWGALLLILVVLLAATAISVALGRSADQFQMSPHFFAMLPLAFVAALLEELGWRGYGVDSLRERFSWVQTTFIFCALWALWHVPLFFIQGTYQQSLLSIGGMYVANFFISMVPATIISNWVYFKMKRSIWAMVLFHFTLVATAELLQTQPFTKCIITVLLLVVSMVLIKDQFLRDRDKTSMHQVN